MLERNCNLPARLVMLSVLALSGNAKETFPKCWVCSLLITLRQFQSPSIFITTPGTKYLSICFSKLPSWDADPFLWVFKWCSLCFGSQLQEPRHWEHHVECFQSPRCLREEVSTQGEEYQRCGCCAKKRSFFFVWGGGYPDGRVGSFFVCFFGFEVSQEFVGLWWSLSDFPSSSLMVVMTRCNACETV